MQSAHAPTKNKPEFARRCNATLQQRRTTRLVGEGITVRTREVTRACRTRRRVLRSDNVGFRREVEEYSLNACTVLSITPADHSEATLRATSAISRSKSPASGKGPAWCHGARYVWHARGCWGIYAYGIRTVVCQVPGQAALRTVSGGHTFRAGCGRAAAVQFCPVLFLVRLCRSVCEETR